MAIKLGTSDVKKIFLGTSSVKLAYLDTSLVFARPQAVTLSLNSGVASVSWNATSHDGKVTTGTITSTTTLTFGYDTYLKLTPVAKSGYKMDAYTSAVTITADKTYYYTASASSYTTTMNFIYSGTSYSTIGSILYSTDNTNWYTASSTKTFTLTYGSKIYLKTPTAKPGFAFSSVTYNGSTISASGGVYTITVGSGNYNLYVNFTSSTVTSSISWSYANTITTNTLSRSAFTVTCTLSLKLNAASAGAVLGTIPADYRPSTNKTMTTDWYFMNNTKQNTATITFATNGNVTSSAASEGTGTRSAGGKWGSTTFPVHTQIVGTVTWSVA